MISFYLSADGTCSLIPPPFFFEGPFTLPVPLDVGCTGFFVFGKEIPCLCGGGCPWVFICNHIYFDLLLLLESVQCARRSDKNISLKDEILLSLSVMCVFCNVSTVREWFWRLWESGGGKTTWCRTTLRPKCHLNNQPLPTSTLFTHMITNLQF